MHWVSIKHAIKAEVREYDRLFMDESPDTHPDKDFMELLNPESLKIIEAYVEPSLKDSKLGEQISVSKTWLF